MNKTYKVSYKTYFNDRLKQVPFYGKKTYPLYVQMTFNRKTIFFKSHYFELLSSPRYALNATGKKHGPTIEDIIEKEETLIDFVIDKTIEDFSLDRFKKQYAFYGADMGDATEEGLREYLFTFFHDKGMPALAETIKEGSKQRVLYDVVQDLKTALDKTLYGELVENSIYYAPPYLPLFGFMREIRKWPFLCLLVMEWEDDKIKSRFEDYLSRMFPGRATLIIEQVDNWIKALAGG